MPGPRSASRSAPRPAARAAARPERRVLIGTACPDVLEELARLAAAAHVEPLVAHDPAALARWWAQAPLVLVGADLAQSMTSSPARRARVVLVSRSGTSESLWRLAVAIGAEEVAVLPDAAPWLVDRMGEAGDGSRQALTVAVMGCVGGAGTTTLVAGLARCAAGHGLASAVVDADPTGGDLDVALDMVDDPGLRWSDLAGSRGRVPASALRSALPERSGVALVCDGQDAVGSPVPDEAARAVVSALSRAFDLVIVETPRWLPDTARAAADDAEVLLLVTTADRRGVVAARRLLARLSVFVADRRLVVRAGRGAGRGLGLAADDVAGALDLPLAATLSTDPRLATDLGHADLRLRPSLRRACEAVLAGLVGSADQWRS